MIGTLATLRLEGKGGVATSHENFESVLLVGVRWRYMPLNFRPTLKEEHENQGR